MTDEIIRNYENIPIPIYYEDKEHITNNQLIFYYLISGENIPHKLMVYRYLHSKSAKAIGWLTDGYFNV